MESQDLASVFSRFQTRLSEGAMTAEEWNEFGQTGQLFFDRFQRAGSSGDPEDLTRAHQIASAGAKHTQGGLNQQFLTQLTAVLLVQHRKDLDPDRRAAIAGIARQLCRSYEQLGTESSLRRVVEVARLWEDCAKSAEAANEAAEASEFAIRALTELQG